MVVMQELQTNGFIKIILLTKHAHLIKLLDMIMELVVQLWLNVKIASQVEDAGLNKKQKYMELLNMEK